MAIKKRNIKNTPSQTNGNGFWSFLEFKGKAGTKDVKFLVGFYLFCWLIIAVSYKEIPTELIYVVALFPFLFFGFALIFWGLKSLFSLLYRKLSQISYTLVCSVLLLLYTCFITIAFMQLKAHGSHIGSFPLAFIPVFLLLIFTAFFSYQIVTFWMFDDSWKDNRMKVKKYLPIHLLLYLVLVLVGILYKQNIVSSDNSIGSNFFFFICLQFAIYGLYSFAVWLRVLFISIISFNNKK